VVSSFVTLLREGFEVTLLVAIVLAYLVKIERREDFRLVWYGLGAALVVSLAVGAILFATAGGLEGRAEYIFEGTAMWVAVGFLTYMILWMRRESRTVARSIREGIDSALERGSSLALVSLVFVMALREGIETALFIFGISRTSEPLQVALGAVLGIAGAVALGYVVYAGGKRIDLGTFFKVTGVFLILVAAGLLAHGVAEFQEAGLLPTIMPLWDVSSAPVLGEDSLVSQFLTAFFGWDAEANLLELLAWFTYVVVVGYAFLRPQPLPKGAASPATRNN
jgi:high-affinity iron transporter